MPQEHAAQRNTNATAETEFSEPTTAFFTAEDENTSAYRSVAGLWLMTFLSRVLGVARDILMARFIFGWILDAFVLGFTIQNMFRRFLGEGTLQAVVVPAVVKRLKKADRSAANRLIKGVATRTFVYTMVVSVVVAAGLFVASLFTGDQTPVKLRFMAIMFPYGPLVCLGGAIAAGLNAYRHFAIPAVTPIVMNVALITGVVLVWFFGSPYMLVAALIVGGAFEVLVLLPLSNREGIVLRPVWSDDTGEIGAIFKAVVPVAAAVAVLEVNVLTDRVIADVMLSDGAVGILYLSNRLIQLPLALFGINLATVFLTRISAIHEENVPGKVEKAFLDAVRMVNFLCLPAAAGIAVTAMPVSLFLFWGGKLALTPEAMPRIVWAVVFFSPGIVFYSLAAVATRVYYARGDVKRPAIYAAIAAVVNIVLDIVFVIVFERYMNAGEGGLAFASSLSGLVLLMLLLWSLVPQGRRQSLLWNFLSALAIGGVTAVALWMRLLPSLAAWAGIDMSAQSGFEGQVAVVGLALAAGVAVFLMLCLSAVEERLLPDEKARVGMFSSILRITLCVIPTAMFAFLAARSIPPERFGFWDPMERALAPVILGAFAYWLLIGIFGVKEYDELRAALGRRKGADTGRPA